MPPPPVDRWRIGGPFASAQRKAKEGRDAKAPLHVTKHGLTRTPHRVFMRAMGLGDADIAKPMVGVVSTKGEPVAA